MIEKPGKPVSCRINANESKLLYAYKNSRPELKFAKPGSILHDLVMAKLGDELTKIKKQVRYQEQVETSSTPWYAKLQDALTVMSNRMTKKTPAISSVLFSLFHPTVKNGET